MNAPFTAGLAQNFHTWQRDTERGNIAFEEGRLAGVVPGTDIRALDGRGFYQIVKGLGDFEGGVWRRFLGLTPGHIYAVSARMNTLQTTEGDWSFSLHVAYEFDGIDLTAQQMAGLAALPDRSIGPTAGMITEFKPGRTTAGEWQLVPRGQADTGLTSGKVTLPDQAKSIIVWFRFKGNGIKNGSVGLDSLKLEDIGPK